MSFGYAIGDIAALLSLFERVAIEVRNYQNAPRHFQQLAAELKLLQTTLHRLLQIEPSDEEEKQQLECTRAVAIHCSLPLQAFVAKMRPKEPILGHRRSAGTLSTIGTRLHWSLVTRRDVEELRSVVLAGMTAINISLGMQQLTLLRKLVLRISSEPDIELRELFQKSNDFFFSATTNLRNINRVPELVAKLEVVISKGNTQREQHASKVENDIRDIKKASQSVLRKVMKNMDKAQKVRLQISQAVKTIMYVALDLHRVFEFLQLLSKDIIAKVATNGRTLLDIHSMMKRILQAIEAIPLHLTLGIVRLDDGLGESWALPYQVCRTFSGFHDILQTLVFGNNRPGAMHVDFGRYLIRTAHSRLILTEQNWETEIKEGAHVTQAIIVSYRGFLAKCTSQECPGGPSWPNIQTDTCEDCGGPMTIEPFSVAQARIDTVIESGYSLAPHSSKFPAMDMPIMFSPYVDMSFVDEVSLFRNKCVYVEKEIFFTDAFNQKYIFPFHRVDTWNGITDMIRQLCDPQTVIGAHIANGEYDLIGPDKKRILPLSWKRTIKPGWTVTMRLWSVAESSPRDSAVPEATIEVLVAAASRRSSRTYDKPEKQAQSLPPSFNQSLWYLGPQKR